MDYAELISKRYYVRKFKSEPLWDECIKVISDAVHNIGVGSCSL